MASMADAIDAAHTVIYCVSQAYKDSQNCRLEAMYAHQIGVQMVPVMLEDNYQPNGWLGMLLGTRLWYGMFGTVLSDSSLFDAKVGELCRELERSNAPRTPQLSQEAQAELAPAASIAPSPAPTHSHVATPTPLPSATTTEHGAAGDHRVISTGTPISGSEHHIAAIARMEAELRISAVTIARLEAQLAASIEAARVERAHVVERAHEAQRVARLEGACLTGTVLVVFAACMSSLLIRPLSR